MTTQPLLADNVLYVHGMDLYDINGSVKHGSYISSYYSLLELPSHTVVIGDEEHHIEQGWFLTRNEWLDNVPTGFEIPIEDYFSSLETLEVFKKLLRKKEILAQIKQLALELKSLSKS